MQGCRTAVVRNFRMPSAYIAHDHVVEIQMYTFFSDHHYVPHCLSRVYMYQTVWKGACKGMKPKASREDFSVKPTYCTQQKQECYNSHKENFLSSCETHKRRMCVRRRWCGDMHTHTHSQNGNHNPRCACTKG